MLVEYAKFLVRDSQYLASLIASSDGGIAYELSKIRMIEHLHVYYINGNRLYECKKLIELIHGLPCPR